MPYRSSAQRKFFHANVGKKRGLTGKVVKEFDNTSRGTKLPEKVPKRKFKYAPPKKND